VGGEGGDHREDVRKRISKRRWKARAKAGRELPLTAIVDYNLERWFKFVASSPFRDFYRAHPIDRTPQAWWKT
jgi:hypothetical protein